MRGGAHWDGGEVPFPFSELKRVMATTLWIDGASVFSIPLCPPDRVYRSPPCPFSWKLRHNTQKVPATLPSVSHARLDSFCCCLLVSNSERTGTETDRDERERERGDTELKWHCNLTLAGALFRTEDLSCSSTIVKMNIFL